MDIGGNQYLHLQMLDESTENTIAEDVLEWKRVHSLWGFLDLMSGDAKYNYNAKIQESTHIFIADYEPLPEGLTAENCRAMDENGLIYEVTLMDDPMNLHEQWEILLKYTGGQ